MRTLPKRFTQPYNDTAAPMTEDWPGRDLLDTPMLARVLLAAWGGDAAICVPACPGAGKSRLVALLAGALAHRVGLRVAVASIQYSGKMTITSAVPSTEYWSTRLTMRS